MFAIENARISAMPPKDVNRLLGWALIYPSFKEELLDPEKRLGALNKFQNPDNKDPMFGIGAEIQPGQLTLRETKALMGIKAETLEEFSKACVEAKLTGETGAGRPPESGQ